MSSNLPLKRNWGEAAQTESKALIRQLDEMYTDVANQFSLLVKKNILNGSDPAATDQRNKFFSIGDVAVRTDTNNAWIMTSRTTPETVVWTQIS